MSLFLDLPGPDPARQGGRPGGCLRRRRQFERVRDQGRRRLHPGHDDHGGNLDRPEHAPGRPLEPGTRPGATEPPSAGEQGATFTPAPTGRSRPTPPGPTRRPPPPTNPFDALAPASPRPRRRRRSVKAEPPRSRMNCRRLRGRTLGTALPLARRFDPLGRRGKSQALSPSSRWTNRSDPRSIFLKRRDFRAPEHDRIRRGPAPGRPVVGRPSRSGR